jgi:two-component sensor histidine kinase
MAVHLALMLHELGTNAGKYGSLTTDKGWVAISWSVAGDVLNLQWVERGGPKVSAPTQRGFGTTLIEQSAKSEGGNAELVLAGRHYLENSDDFATFYRAPKRAPSSGIDEGTGGTE